MVVFDLPATGLDAPSAVVMKSQHSDISTLSGVNFVSIDTVVRSVGNANELHVSEHVRELRHLVLDSITDLELDVPSVVHGVFLLLIFHDSTTANGIYLRYFRSSELLYRRMIPAIAVIWWRFW